MSLTEPLSISPERRPRLAVFALSTYSSIGGLQQFNRRLINALSRLGKTQVVLRSDTAHDIPRETGVRFLAAGNSKALFAVKGLFAALRSDALFVAHINLMPLAVIAKIIRPNLRVVLMTHGDEVWDDALYRKRRPWDRICLSIVDHISAVSEHTAAKVSEKFGVDPFVVGVLPNAVDSVHEAMPGCRPPNEVLCVTRLARHDRGKNVDSLLHAMALVLQERPETHLTIIGDGPLRPELEALSSCLGLRRAVTFKGRVTHDVLDEAYRNATVFALPSSKEGFGIVFLEAWQRGVPVITGTEDAARTLVEEGIDGFSVHHDDHDALARRLLLLLRNPFQAAAMGRAGETKVRRNFSAAAFERRLAELVEVL